MMLMALATQKMEEFMAAASALPLLLLLFFVSQLPVL